MPRVIQNKFDGGHAEDIRTFAVDECEKSLNFDLFTNPHKLIPYGDSVAETTASYDIEDVQLDNVDLSLIGSTYTLTATGLESDVSTKAAFWTKSDITNGSTLNWSRQAVAGTTPYQSNSGVVYKDKMYALTNNAGTVTLNRFNSAGSVTNCGSFTGSASAKNVKPFVHPEDNKLYIVSGNVIAYYDGTNNIGTSVGTSFSSSTILPTGYTAVGLTSYGGYLAIAMTPNRGAGVSYVYLWGRDASINTLQGVIDFGEGAIQWLENLNENLFALIYPQNILPSSTSYKIRIRGYAGGTVQTIKTLTVSNLNGQSVRKVKSNEKVFFALTNDDCVYVLGKNKEGQYIVTKDRYLINGTTAGSAVYGLSVIGDTMWRAVSTSSASLVLMRSKVEGLGESISYSATSTYRTTINPSMSVFDRNKKKQLTSFKIYYTGKANGTVAVKYLVDGKNSAGTTSFETILSESTTAIETYTNATQLNDGQVFASGTEYQFQIESTGGVEIKAFEYTYENLND